MLGIGLSVPQCFDTSSFNALSLFAAGEQGVWFDPSDFSTLFQDSVGTTPVRAVGDPVGLILDKSQGLVLGGEKVANGDFSNGTTNWGQFNGTRTVFGGEMVLTATAGAAFPQVTQTISGLTVGKMYLMTGTARRGTTTDDVFISPISGTNAKTSSTSPTALRVMFTATATTTSIAFGIFSAAANGAAVFDNISVREVAGTHAKQPTANSRPLLQQDTNGRYHLVFDGSDDWLQTDAVNPGSANKAQIIAGLRKTGTADGMIAELSADVGNNAGSLYIGGPMAGAAWKYAFVSKGTATSATLTTDTAYNSPVTNVLTGLSDISSDNAVLRINGTQVSSSASDQGTGNYGSYPLFIGRRGGSSLPFKGNLFGLVLRFSADNLASDTIARAERWMASKAGLAL